MGTAMASIDYWLRGLRWACVSEHVVLLSKPVVPGVPRSDNSPVVLGDSRISSSTGLSVPDSKVLASDTNISNRQLNYWSAVEQDLCSVQALLQQILRALDKAPPVRYTRLCQLCAKLSWLIQKVTANGNGKLRQHLVKDDEVPERLRKEANALASHVFHNTYSSLSKDVIRVCAASISELVQEFALDITRRECESLVQDLRAAQDHQRELIVKLLVELAQRGPAVCFLIHEVGFIAALYECWEDLTSDSTRSNALRVLACVAVHRETLPEILETRHFEDLVSAIWTSPTEKVQCEAAGFLAQLVAHLQPQEAEPCQNSQELIDRLVKMSSLVVRGLIRLCRHASDEEVFLVSAACMAYLVMLHDRLPIAELAAQQDIVTTLLLGWDKGLAISLTTVNQILSLLLHYSSYRAGQEYLASDERLPPFFVSFLQRDQPSSTNSETALRNRTRRKCLTIISRLARYELFAERFLRCEGHRSIGNISASPGCEDVLTSLCWKILQCLRTRS